MVLVQVSEPFNLSERHTYEVIMFVPQGTRDYVLFKCALLYLYHREAVELCIKAMH